MKSGICIRQNDLKNLIVYSSVAHRGIVIGGLIPLIYWGYCGPFNLFYLANITYELLGRRRLLIIRVQ